jgi:enamine deaminase RidA (YjgF/YER057c/UK114 family)
MPFTALSPARFPWYDYSRYSFSLGLAAGSGAYLSGHTASEHDPASGRIVVRGGMADQVRTAYAKIAAILEAGGFGLSDVVRIVEYVRPEGIERHAEAAAVRAQVFGAHQPAVYTVPVKSLLRPEAFIEIEVTAGPDGPIVASGAGAAPMRESGGLVFLPSVQPVDEEGGIVGAGDVVAQTRAIFEKAARMLASMGLSMANVVKTNEYLAPAALAALPGTEPVREAFLGPVYPGAASIVMPRMVHPEAMIQVDFIAARGTPVAVDPGWARYRGLTRSPAVKVGRYLFMSGQGALDPETGGPLFEGDVAAQAEFAYGNVIRILEAAGAGPQHLVKTIEYVTSAGLPRYRGVARVRERLLRQPYPASTGLVCEALPRPGLTFEVDPFAILD